MGTRSRSEHARHGIGWDQEDAVARWLLSLWLVSSTLGKVRLLLQLEMEGTRHTTTIHYLYQYEICARVHAIGLHSTLLYLEIPTSPSFLLEPCLGHAVLAVLQRHPWRAKPRLLPLRRLTR